MRRQSWIRSFVWTILGGGRIALLDIFMDRKRPVRETLSVKVAAQGPYFRDSGSAVSDQSPDILTERHKKESRSHAYEHGPISLLWSFIGLNIASGLPAYRFSGKTLVRPVGSGPRVEG